MNKKCLFLFVLLFVQSRSDESDFLKYFKDFADSFFKNVSEIQHVNSSLEDYKQIRDVDLKTIEELTRSLQDDLFKQLQSQVNDAIVVTDNPKTQIYVKTFSHYFDDDLPEENIDEAEIENHQVTPHAETTNINSALKDTSEFTNLNHFPENIEAILANNKDNPTTETGVKEVSIENRFSIEQTTNTSEDKEKAINDTSTTSTVTSMNNNRDDTDNDTEAVTIKKDNKELIEYTTEVLPTTVSTMQTTESSQKDLPDKVSNNETSNVQSDSSSKLTQKQFEKDIRDNIIQTDDNDYDTEEATDYPQIDYIDLYKDTTNEENVYVSTDRPNVIDIKDEIVEKIEEYSLEIVALDNDTSTNICHGNTSNISNIYPWLSTIFIKNDSSNQFQYTCDGALLNDKLLITAARCVIFNNSTVSPDDVLVFLGKTSLQSIGVDEKNVRIAQIKIHSNFSNKDGAVTNDLALLVLETPVAFSDSIRPACLGGDGVEGKSATTSWDLSGTLRPVFLEKNSGNCKGKSEDGTICATYGNAVALCPSHGGLYTSQRGSRWYLQGIRSDDPGFRGVCVDKTVRYTSVAEHLDWIMDSTE